MSNVTLTQFDNWLDDAGPAALVLREYLQPVEGPDGVVFPATYAPAEDKTKFAGGYNIDSLGKDANGNETNVCLIDSVGSQANRIEPLFLKEGYRELVPQVVVVAGEKRVNLLEAGHRAGDAIVRCSALGPDLTRAFKELLAGNAGPLTKLAPTSLVFGVWDSRNTQAKVPRLMTSVIRAFNVRPLRRSAQYVPVVEYVEQGLLAEPETKSVRDTYSERGFIHVPASGQPGGVLVNGDIRRDVTLSLVVLRQLAVREGGSAGLSTDGSKVLRRYILGLALTAFTYPMAGQLRQGCLLIANPEKPREFNEVYADGRRVPATVTHDIAVTYAKAAAAAFGVGESREVEFDRRLAIQDTGGAIPDAEVGEPKAEGRKPAGKKKGGKNPAGEGS
jgi:CRISPR-associated protein Csb1